MEKKWISASEIAKQANVPESTTRRYLNNFDKFFKYQERSRGKKYHPDAIIIITRIQSLYNAGSEGEEIEDILVQEYPITIDSQETTTVPPPVAPYATTEDIAKIIHKLEQQEEFNKALLNRLDLQKEYIEKSLEQRDHNLMAAIREVQETKKLIAAGEEKKKWWKFWE